MQLIVATCWRFIKLGTVPNRYLQSGRHGEMCGILFTSNLRKNENQTASASACCTRHRGAGIIERRAASFCLCLDRGRDSNWVIHKAGNLGRLIFLFLHRSNSPCYFDHFGPEGFDMLQESLHSFPSANDGLWKSRSPEINERVAEREKERQPSLETQTGKTFVSYWRGNEEVGHTLPTLHNCLHVMFHV